MYQVLVLLFRLHLQSCQLSSTEIKGCDPGAVVCLGVGQLSVSDEASRVFRNVGTLYRTVPGHISERSTVLCLVVS